MNALWTKHKKTILIGLALVLVVVAGAVAWYLASDDGAPEPAEITSAWPVAERERVIDRPEEPVRWPLTGEDAAAGEDPSAVRMLAIKIENSPAARPQSGLDHADLVYETITEGGITRFTAFFHSRTPGSVGPVRSARMADIDLVPQYAALFAHSGANTGVLNAVRSAGLQIVDHSSATAAYRRVSFRSAPHNLYIDPARARELGVARGYPAEQELRALDFSGAVDSGQPATLVRVPFSPANSVSWEYEEAGSTYLRSNNGQAHVDRESGARYAARNVVVLWARTSATGPTGIGGRTLEIALTGEGAVAIFRDGVRIDGTWQADRGGPPVFRDAEGSIIRLAPGNTWFQVVPTDLQINAE